MPCLLPFTTSDSARVGHNLADIIRLQKTGIIFAFPRVSQPKHTNLAFFAGAESLRSRVADF
jgi:hypothetical protein